MLDRLSSESIPHIRPYTFDRGLLDRVKQTGTPEFRVYPFPFRAVVAGRGSDLSREIHLDRCLADNIPIFRRPGGGCSVFLDPGNLIVSIALPAKGFGGIQALFDKSNQWLINGFSALGLTRVYQDGISDLVLDNRKIGGTCLYRTKGFAYYSASLLVNPDLDRMDTYLPHPPREPAYRRGRSHNAFLVGLTQYIPNITPGELTRGLSQHLDLGEFRELSS